MIGFFPNIYEDELVYSLLARYYVQTGLGMFRGVSEELFTDKSSYVEIEFINKLNPEVLKVIKKNCSMEELLFEHTMFPFYGRFISKERREKGYSALLNMDGNYNNLFPMPNNRKGQKRYLRVCPECTDIDRRKYGETYWHRIHQLPSVNICPIHKCFLYESNIEISRKSISMLVSAEEVIPYNLQKNYTDNQLECKLANYIMEVFQSKFNMESEVTIGQFLHSKLAYTKYVSSRGQQRNIKLLTREFNEYYKEMGENVYKELFMIQDIFLDRRYNMNEICMLAMFLGVDYKELKMMTLPEKPQQQEFDERVKLFRGQGMSYRKISEIMNAPYDVVKPVGENRYGTYEYKKSRSVQSHTNRKRDWSKEDESTLPLVRLAVKELQGAFGNRPRKVNVHAVGRKLGFHRDHVRYHLPRCRAEIEAHMEVQEKYWAREVVWAVKKLQEEGGPIFLSTLLTLTNMRKVNFVDCIPYLSQFADNDLVERILRTIKR